MKKTMMIALLSVLVVLNMTVGCVYLDKLVKGYTTQKMDYDMDSVYKNEDAKNVNVSDVKRTGLFTYGYTYCINRPSKVNNYNHVTYVIENCTLRDMILDN